MADAKALGQNELMHFRCERKVSGAKDGKQGGLWERQDRRSRMGPRPMESLAQG